MGSSQPHCFFFLLIINAVFKQNRQALKERRLSPSNEGTSSLEENEK